MANASRDDRALIVVDPQPDFFEGGPLPVPGATRVAHRIAEYLADHGDEFALKVVSQDWHLEPGSHWSDHPDFVTTWPVHCVAHSDGARIHPILADQSWDVVMRKGQHEGAYSGFEGISEGGAKLADVLQAAEVTSLTIIGFATDHCVKATALDARALGFAVTVVLDLCASVDPDTTRVAIAAMTNAGIDISTSDEL